jgi:hypothetical protein
MAGIAGTESRHFVQAGDFAFPSRRPKRTLCIPAFAQVVDKRCAPDYPLSPRGPGGLILGVTAKAKPNAKATVLSFWTSRSAWAGRGMKP